MSTGPRQTVHSDPVVRPGRRLVAVSPATDAYAALTMMRRNELRHLPVVDGDRCVGLLSEAHLLTALASEVDGGDALTAGVLCRRPAPVAPPGSSLRTLAATMLDAGVDAVLVVNHGVVVGIVTGSDVLGAITGRWPAVEAPDGVRPASARSDGARPDGVSPPAPRRSSEERRNRAP